MMGEMRMDTVDEQLLLPGVESQLRSQRSVAPIRVRRSTAVWHHYVVVRRDYHEGVRAAMIIHAAGETGLRRAKPNAVALWVKDEDELRDVAALLKQNGVKHLLVHEPDAPWCGQLMAIGIEPGPRETFYRLLRNLRRVGF
jgi:hypothetical protein